MEPDLELDLAPETVRHAALPIPLAAMRVDEDTPTLVVAHSALAALAERSMETTVQPRPRRPSVEDERALRRAVIGIWTVAAILLATLGILVR